MESLPLPKRPLARAHQILKVAAVLHIALFGLESRGTLRALFAPQPVTPSDRTGAFVKGADCIGYYAWLRSPLLDGDFHFDDEYAPMFARVPQSTAVFSVTTTGHRANPWPVGPAITWAPAVVSVHLFLRGLGSDSPWPADGYSPPYQLAVGLTTLALALLTLFLAYRIGCCYAGPVNAAAAAALITLGTPVVAYGAVEVSMAHGPATAALTLFAFAWLRTFGSVRPGRWVGLGCLLGLACLMRWQLVTFAVLLVLEAVWLAAQADNWPARVGLALRLAAAGLMATVVFVPQFAAKQIVYGHPLGGLHRTGQNWLDPAFWAVLGSPDRGLFYWTPFTLPALGGLVYLTLRSRRPAPPILAAAIVIQIYVVAAMMGGDVCLGWSFGFRLLTETCVLMVPGIAVLFDGVSRRTARRLAVAGCLLVGWNILLIGVYRHCIGGRHGADPAEMLGLVVRYIYVRPLEAVGVLAAVGWLMCRLVGAYPLESPNGSAEVEGATLESSHTPPACS